MLQLSRLPAALVLLTLLSLAVPRATHAQRPATLPYQDATRSIDERVEDLLGRMTLEEKVGQMTQLTLQTVTKGRPTTVAGPTALEPTVPTESTGEIFDETEIDPDMLRDVLANHHVGSMLNVVSRGYPVETWQRIIRTIQEEAARTRLGIPVLYGVDAVHGANYIVGGTLYPHNLALAATFNTELSRLSGEVTARETGATGVPWNFAPVLDLGRNPIWPRFYETFGEDVLVTQRMSVAYVEGYQGSDLTRWDHGAATGKHFVGYSNPLTGKDRTTAFIPEIELRARYLPPFQAAIDAGMRTIMVNSADINGVPVHASRALLTDLLRGELGFTGVVVSDWEDIIKLHTVHRTAASEREATRQAIEAGVDLSMVPLRLTFYDELLSLVQDGEVSEARIDESVRRLLTLKFELGLFENAMPPAVAAGVVGTPQARQSSLEAARQSLVLLQNDGVLPLRAGQRVLVTGPTADDLSALNGGWTYTWQGADPSYTAGENAPTILGALRAAMGEGNVTYVPGSGFDAALDLDAAVSAARDADVAVVCVGERPYAEKPGDIDDLTLDQAQLDLVAALQATGTPVVLVLVEGRPRLITSVAEGAGAIVGAFLPGSMGGQAIADVLVGSHNPSGRMPFSYPRSTGTHIPYDHTASSAPTVQYAGEGRTSGYYPLFAFGHGLSYTTFAYSGLTVAPRVGPNAPVEVQVTVQNTGARAGRETVLVYLRDLYASVSPAMRRLVEFDSVTLAPGEQQTMRFVLPPSALAFVGEDGTWRTEPGGFEVIVGDQSAGFVLDGPGE